MLGSEDSSGVLMEGLTPKLTKVHTLTPIIPRLTYSNMRSKTLSHIFYFFESEDVVAAI
jgi:hypothetical protein